MFFVLTLIPGSVSSTVFAAVFRLQVKLAGTLLTTSIAPDRSPPAARHALRALCVLQWLCRRSSASGQPLSSRPLVVGLLVTTRQLACLSENCLCVKVDSLVPRFSWLRSGVNTFGSGNYPMEHWQSSSRWPVSQL